MINNKRLDDMFFLFGLVLPLGDEQKKTAFEAIVGMKLEEIVPIVLKGISEQIKANPEAGEGYLDFVVQAIQYAKEETDDLPETQYDPEKLKQILMRK